MRISSIRTSSGSCSGATKAEDGPSADAAPEDDEVEKPACVRGRRARRHSSSTSCGIGVFFFFRLRRVRSGWKGAGGQTQPSGRGRYTSGRRGLKAFGNKEHFPDRRRTAGRINLRRVPGGNSRHGTGRGWATDGGESSGSDFTRLFTPAFRSCCLAIEGARLGVSKQVCIERARIRVESGTRGRLVPPGAREAAAAARMSSWQPGQVRARGCPQADDQ